MANLFLKIILNILYFPLWWYSKGLRNVILAAGRQISLAGQNLGLRIWLASLFKPMYRQYSRSGRLISFFMRLIVLVWRLFLILLLTILEFILILIWIGLPVFIVYQIVIISRGTVSGVWEVKGIPIYYPRF